MHGGFSYEDLIMFIEINNYTRVPNFEVGNMAYFEDEFGTPLIISTSSEDLPLARLEEILEKQMGKTLNQFLIFLEALRRREEQ